MSFAAVIAVAALAGPAEAPPVPPLFKDVPEIPRIAGAPTPVCSRMSIRRPGEGASENPFTCLLMPAEGFEATVRAYADGLAMQGWHPTKRLGAHQVAVLQKNLGLGACRRLWITLGPKVAKPGTDMATVPQNVNFELHPKTQCWPVEKAS